MNRRTQGPRRGEAGGASVELVILTPVVLSLFLFVVAGGRLADARAKVDGAARDSARAASIARSPGRARSEGSAAAESRLTAGGVECRELQVDTDTSAFRAGGRVTSTISCSVDLGDLTLLRIPGRRTVTATATEPVDFHRGIRP